MAAKQPDRVDESNALSKCISSGTSSKLALAVATAAKFTGLFATIFDGHPVLVAQAMKLALCVIARKPSFGDVAAAPVGIAVEIGALRAIFVTVIVCVFGGGLRPFHRRRLGKRHKSHCPECFQ